ncbi:GDSL-type esterase/lipase family protein [Acidaminococcus sp. NSJ-142]|uniref:SGNH/GDSL hydrolase family protein n=1 Tax=Acidaminococcus TaxID=904 RepID=UPI001E65C8D2|nr:MULTISPECIES: GDSL-type esterase/lipase family protein [Acidaminococcus]MCD2435643.1 GDSL-type esterase/lipase family protein [Acidaminococcus hominis]MCH4097073.1 GDSL-type esterase/lipase family protein [Acidaminococcus provencensis]
MLHQRAPRPLLGKVLMMFLLPALLLGTFTAQRLKSSPAAALSSEEEPVQQELGMIQWPQNLNAVRYEVEIFPADKTSPDPQKPAPQAVYRNEQVFTSNLLLPEQQFAQERKQNIPLLWRVRAFDLDGNPITPYSQPQSLTQSWRKVDRDAPLPRPSATKGNATVLLYPVYAYTGNPGAEKYEVEVTDRYPENPEGYLTSRYRVYAEETVLTDLYDAEPRIGEFYWRVRGMDKNGRPVGIWSEPQKITNNPDKKWVAGIYGDSISHGGGHLSFSPVDYAYSYGHYLNFPVINLSQSGDTSEMMVDRFDQDVTPFHIQYLLIMGGSNSLRAGVPAEDVIADLKTLQQKARERGIMPILLTLPPINPANIQKAFDEPTDENWQAAFAEVNRFIRTQPHIDVAAPFEAMGDELPTNLALDGIHGDWNMKKIMGRVINQHIGEFKPLS